eukprot:6399009-Alexandrium_andersonii.AAC.1
MKGKYFFTKEALDKVLPPATPIVKALFDRFPLFGCPIYVLVDLMRVILVDPGRYFHYGKSPRIARRVKQ